MHVVKPLKRCDKEFSNFQTLQAHVAIPTTQTASSVRGEEYKAKKELEPNGLH